MIIQPDHANAIANQAILFGQHHDFDRAAKAQRRLCQLKPQSAQGLVRLAGSLRGLGDPGRAALLLRRARILEPADGEALTGLANTVMDLGHPDDAARLFRIALRLEPSQPQLWFNLANTLSRIETPGQTHLVPAISAFRNAIILSPAFAEAHCVLTDILTKKGRLEEATICCQRALAVAPAFAEAHGALGNIRQKEGRLDPATVCYRNALGLKPDYAEAHSNLGFILQQQGRLDEAVACFRTALDLSPRYVEAHCNLGLVLRQQGRLDEAVASLRTVLDLKPHFVEAHGNLGSVLQQQGRLDEAVACLRTALDLNPDYVEAHCSLGFVLQQQGRLDEAIRCYRKAVDLKPDDAEAISALVQQLQNTCCWDDLGPLQDKVMGAITSSTARIAPFLVLGLDSTLADQLACARHFGEYYRVPPETQFRHQPRTVRRKIRLGYLSADFRNHAVAFLAAELFERHDRSRFEIFAYSYSPDDKSPIRARMIATFDHFIEISMLSDAAAARRICDDGIDILVDLAGYTERCRTGILARRPAPLQVNYLGYPGTMAQDFIDHIIVDRFVAPIGEQPYYGERRVQLPDCYQPNDTKRKIADRQPTRIECGLPEQGFVFCCFNNSWKITPIVFAVWLRLLKAVPGSVLWLLEANSWARDNLRHEAARRGIAPDRLVFAPRMALPEHLARHCQADLFVDTLPYNAHTTASDALWAGLPVLTCTGNTFAGRVATSLLRAIELPELITTSLADYEARALALATQPTRLAEVRQRLKDNRSTTPLFDIERLTRNIEKAYTSMWDRWLDGKPAAPIVIPSV
ncbi:MAG: tetratricopeptide repeat protein [Azospirillaceae bacterium]|nr:tetratricopeptide repeat protein [Azospirillaceae bacterium]